MTMLPRYVCMRECNCGFVRVRVHVRVHVRVRVLGPGVRFCEGCACCHLCFVEGSMLALTVYI